MKINKLITAFSIIICLSISFAKAQGGGINWTKDGNSYYQNAGGSGCG